MPYASNSFDQHRENQGTARWIIIAGIVVLILAVLAAVFAGRTALNERAAQQTAASESTTAATVTVTAPPSRANEIVGTFAGKVNNAHSDRDSAAWNMTVTFGGNTASLGYPDSGCFVHLNDPREVHGAIEFSAHAITRKCKADGTWSFRTTDSGLFAEYSESNEVVVHGDISRT